MDSRTHRKISNYHIIVRIKYQTKIANEIVDKEDDLCLYRTEKIEHAFNKYLTKNGITFYRNKIKSFYLIKNDEYILLDKKKEIQNLGLNTGDLIEVKKREETLEINTEVIYDIKTRRSIKNKKQKDYRKFFCISGIVISILAVLILASLLLYFFILKKKKEIIEEKINYSDEKLVTKIGYNSDSLYRYQSIKKTDMIVEGLDIKEDNAMQSIEQYIDFIFMIRNKFFEIENNETKKYWYSGYIGILNITINNGTDNINIFYDNDLNKYLNKNDRNKNNNLRILNESNIIDDTLVNEEENETSCFIKIEFYENGEIKNIFLPQFFTSSNMIFIDNIISLIIPKLSPKLYVDDINNKLIELKYNIDDSDEEENEFENEDEDTFDESSQEQKQDFLNQESDKNLESDIIDTNRRLQDINDYDYEEEDELSDINNYEEKIDDDIEDFTVQKSNTEENINLRECKDINNTLDNYTNTNLTQFSYQPLENDDMSLKDSELNTVIYSNINEKRILSSIKEIQTAVLNQPEKNDNEEIKKTEEQLRKEIYNSNNEISLEEANFDNNIYNNLTFNLSKISMESVNDISLTFNYDNDKLRRELFKYFDSFEYTIYNNQSEESNKNKLRILNNKNENKKNNKAQKKYEKTVLKNLSKKRKLDNNEFYGMKNFVFTREFFDYNLLGLALKGTAVCEIEPSTGVVINYFDLGMSIFNKKFKLATQQTNLHVILENLNKMTYGFISLLYQSNINLENNNIKYGDIIINIEKNVSNLFERYFDYSGIFTESLGNLYLQVSNFTGQFLSDLIKLIDDCHNNYTLIYIKGKNNSYEFINQIREITKESYIEYIHNMINNLNNFNNHTLKFLNDIKEETIQIEIFQIDLLYDIIDLIYDAKIIFKQFNQNL